MPLGFGTLSSPELKEKYVFDLCIVLAWGPVVNKKLSTCVVDCFTMFHQFSRILFHEIKIKHEQ